LRCASALGIHELLPEVYSEICQGNDSYIELAQDNRITKVGMDANAELAFRMLKKAFTDEPIHQHFDLMKPIILQTDASGFAIAGILNQYDGFGSLRPVNVYS